MAKPNMKNIQKMFDSGEDFSLTEKQYLNKTGATIPKDGYYLTHRSAIARAAQENGFAIIIQERTIIFKKVDKK